jgi:hypothetical protein
VYKQYPDLRDDCNEMQTFEAAGVAVRVSQYLVMSMFTVTVLVYNAVSAADAAWSLQLGPFQVEVSPI